MSPFHRKPLSVRSTRVRRTPRLEALEDRTLLSADPLLGSLGVAGGLSVVSDGVLEVRGQVRAAGPIQLSGHTVLLAGQVRADGFAGGTIAVSAGSVVQGGRLEADGSHGAGGSIRVD